MSSPPAAPASSDRSAAPGWAAVPPLERRILILAPAANDAALAAGLLRQAGLESAVCGDIDDLAARLHEGCGVLLLAEEALHPASLPPLLDALKSQPSWSDIPITLVCSAEAAGPSPLRRQAALGPATAVALIERPFRPDTLVSMLQSALRSRVRQYQMRDLLDELAANEARLRRILEQTIVGLAELDLGGRFTLVNDRYCATVGRARDELLRLALPDLTHPDDRDEAVRRLAALAADEVPSFIVEKRFLRPDGAIVWVQDHLATVRDAAGRPCGITVASVDITERKRSEAALARARDEAVAASRAKDDFLASLSHELRTPLNPVLLLASEGARNPDLPPPLRADFEVIARNVALEARLIDDLLDLTRITRGKLQLDRRPCALHAVIEDALATVQADADEKRLRLERRLLPANPVVIGDPVRLQQVFWNVLKNAVKFTPLGGTVIIATRLLPNGHAAVDVTDTGIGLAREELTRIFDAFVQGQHADGRINHFGGLGLGLAISKMLVDLHAGRITATSPGIGAGATFTIELPVPAPGAMAEPAGPAVPSVAEARAAGRRRRILLVEDHPATRHALATLLRRRNFDVVPTDSLAGAREACHRENVDLIISDIGLPDGTGYQLMQTLGRPHGVKGIALTGYGMDQDVAQSEEAGFAAHLTKPVRIESLDAALREVLAETS